MKLLLKSACSPNLIKSSFPKGGKNLSHFCGSTNSTTCSCFIPIRSMISYWKRLRCSFVPSFSGGKTGGLPYCCSSCAIRWAAALIGIPVQWNPYENSRLYPYSFLNRLMNSFLLSENACPRCSLPFIYGYGNVEKNFFLFKTGAHLKKSFSFHSFQACCSSSISLSRRIVGFFSFFSSISFITFF